MTQRTGDFIRGLVFPFSVVFLSLHFIIPQVPLLPMVIVTFLFGVIINALVAFKTITFKTIKMLEKEATTEEIKETVEGHMFEEVCQYASDKHLNPSLDFTKNGIFLNANFNNSIIGICELAVPTPETKYMSDDYKHCYDTNIDAINKFAEQHPEFRGE